MLLGFHGLLRPGELMQVRAAHFIGARHPGVIVLTLPWTKSGQRLQAVPESVILTEAVTIACARAVTLHLRPQDLVYPGGDKQFRQEFRHCCKVAQLPAMSWLPYSLRRGGATAYFLAEGCLDKTVVRGRWKSAKTARGYIDQSLAALAHIAATPRQEQAIASWGRFLVRLEA